MSAYAAPAPRRISPPRVKFKKPRWPKGDRFWLALIVFYVYALALDVALGDWSVWGVPLDVAGLWLSAWRWKLSRRDEDGPSST